MIVFSSRFGTKLCNIFLETTKNSYRLYFYRSRGDSGGCWVGVEGVVVFWGFKYGMQNITGKTILRSQPWEPRRHACDLQLVANLLIKNDTKVKFGTPFGPHHG